MTTRSAIPNAVTGARLLAVPVLWIFALAGKPVVVGIGLFFAWATDALDGVLARALAARSEWGSRFDSLADTSMFLSGIVWILLLRPDFVQEHAVPLLAWLCIGAAAYLVGWIRFRRLADVHLYSAKAANFLGFLFAAALLTFGRLPAPVFYVVIGVCLVAAVETLVVFATYDRVDEHVGTVLKSRART